MRMRHYLTGIGVIGLLALLAPGAAEAQGIGTPMPAMNGFQPMVKPNDSATPARQVPTGLPGATPGRGAAPADKSVADLSPNDALFDAINRGDIAEARDAINRGADLNAENVLGMTPLELSVDLSRNDITFLLLSLRGASAGAISAKAAAAAANNAATAKPPTERPARAVRVTVTRPAPASLPREYAGSADPGRPDPAVGFLGFGHGAP
jgi:hypothetical protein